MQNSQRRDQRESQAPQKYRALCSWSELKNDKASKASADYSDSDSDDTERSFVTRTCLSFLKNEMPEVIAQLRSFDVMCVQFMFLVARG